MTAPNLKKAVIFLFFCSNVESKVSNTVEIALASNFSSPSSSNANPYGNYFLDGAMMALEANSKVLSLSKIEIKIKKYDYGIDDVQVKSVTDELVMTDAIAVLGYNYSSHALIAAPTLIAKKMPLITPSATATRLNEFDSYIHPTCFNNNLMGKELANLSLNTLKAKKVAIIVAADCSYCVDLSTSFTKRAKELEIDTKVFEILESEVLFDNVIVSLKKEPFDAILVPNHELTSAKIISSITKSGINLPFLGGDGWGNEGKEFFKIINDKAVKGYSITHWHQDDTSDNSTKFVKSYLKRFNKIPNDTAALAYDAMSFLIKAIIKSKVHTRIGLERTLKEQTDFNGVTGKMSFMNGKSPKKDIVILKAESGSFNYFSKSR